MISVTFQVNCAPPWKQAPVDQNEKSRQIERMNALQKIAREVFSDSIQLRTPFSVSIRYYRKNGRSDSANIIGGILDGLEGVLFQNDKLAHEISYVEYSGDQDWYQVSVTELSSGDGR